ncbi:enoyl-CoA hydratase/isomerase family protein [Leucobacter chinensis]|uniref:enoyl-CoA hydratase/isomerase family protein n=1 Tax=Leucobacter chinensis TaxID=2851010 RepID=UPI001C20FBA8|nr:enoyl-CoA hydratase/isomerase family protein [Leucobacter chinensis]
MPHTIQVFEERDVAVVRIDRVEKLNALTQGMRVQIAEHIRAFGVAGASRGIVITGTGPAFSAGEDLREAGVQGQAELMQAVETFHDITRAILESEVPVIAAVNGLAVGGASEVAMSCDARVGTAQSAFMLPENRIGLTISNGSSMFLRRLLGQAARRLVLESPRVEADEALAIGLLDTIVAEADLVGAAVDLAHRWNPEGSATSQHLRLLRPTLAEFEAAVARENVVAAEAWEKGIIQAGLERFWASKAQ